MKYGEMRCIGCTLGGTCGQAGAFQPVPFHISRETSSAISQHAPVEYVLCFSRTQRTSIARAKRKPTHSSPALQRA
jgi:hypothetical protein